MLSIAINRLVAATLLALAHCAVFAKDSPPRVLREPVLGLRIDAAGANLELLPEAERAKCEQTADNESTTGRLWVFARASHAGATYYVVSGYFKRRHPGAGEPLYELDERGGVLTITGTKCVTDGPAREVFDVRDFQETPQPILQELANDLAVRLVRALGGRNRLRIALRNQRIGAAPLPQELRGAFKPYFDTPEGERH